MSMIIVGAGPTGALTASFITKRLPHLTVTLLDKARGCGGRMTTHRFDHCHVDMGAQYITHYNTKQSESTEITLLKDSIFHELIEQKVLVPFQGIIEGIEESKGDFLGHYVSQPGISTIPKYFIEKSKVYKGFGTQLESLEVDGDQVILSSVDGQIFKAESIILTLPVPQCLALKGNVMTELSPSILKQLEQVVYSSRYALGLFFKDPVPTTSWSSKYFDHPIIRYICWDSLKYEHLQSHKSSLLVHSSVPYGLQALDDDKDKVYHTIMEALNQIIPNLPVPTHTHLIRWRYSQVYKGYPNSLGYVTLCNHPLIMLTGDAFTHSNFEGCIEAAHLTINEFIRKTNIV